MGVVNINGRIFSGNNVIVENGKVFIDGESIDSDEKEIKIEISGNIENLTIDYCKGINVTGDVSKLKTMSGNVSVTGNVNGDVETMSGNVKCDDIRGNVKTVSGNIKSNK
jgi:hypothetical protein